MRLHTVDAVFGQRYVDAMEGFPVAVRFPMHWGEMDALSHANNVQYFRWFETGRIAYFEKIGLHADKPGAAGPILATTTANFLTPLSYPVELLVAARVEKIGRTSFTMAYVVARADAPSTPAATGSGVVVMFDYANGLKVPVPDELRAKIRTLEGRDDL